MDDMNHEVQHIVNKDGEKRLIKKRGPSYWISIILAVLLFGSIIFNVGLMIMLGTCASLTGNLGAEKDHSNYNQVSVMGDEKSRNKILEVPVTGILMEDEESLRSRDNVVSRVRNELNAAKKDDSIKGVLIVINSPGGGITASDILWNEIKKFKTEKKVPVVAYCKDVTASGGYYVASIADFIMAHETSIVGNIGVISQFVNVKDLFQKIGVSVNVIKSTTFDGKESVKDMGSPYRTMKPKERKIFQDMINEMWGRFVDVVAEGRKGKLTHEEVEKLADGSIYTGKGAKEKKLVDEVGSKEAAFEQVKKMAKVKDASLIRFKYRYSPLAELFSSRLNTPKEVQLMTELKEDLLTGTPKMMYLWTMD
jgi:protease IV